ncbi:MAG: HesB/IscA family protein [Thiogranum sp.]
MITVTPDAAGKILESAKLSDSEGMPLRIAVTRMEDGSFHYALGFDDIRHDDDKSFHSEGIDIIVGSPSAELLNGTVIDYVELDGNKEIIFINPNDPARQSQG